MNSEEILLLLHEYVREKQQVGELEKSSVALEIIDRITAKMSERMNSLISSLYNAGGDCV